MGNNKHGNQNEKSIAQAINNKQFKELSNLNLKTFIKEIYPSVQENTLIMCPYSAGMKKQDLHILIGEKSYYISLKTGSGNSIHQEKLEPFIQMLKENYNADENILNDIRFFIWGDGTYNGTGAKTDRLSSNELKKQYPELMKNIQAFFEEHKKDLLNRFLVTGRFDGYIDYIYYGTVLNGTWCSASSALKFHCEQLVPKGSGIKLGNTTFQSWNRCIKGTAKEKQRDTIQLKWASIEKDIASIRKSDLLLNMGTQEGDTQEFSFCKELNRNRTYSNRYWKILKEQLNLENDIENIYAVKVNKKVFSKLAGKKVLPKTDVYLVKANLQKEVLLLNNHILDEDIIKNLDYEVIENSGISIKRKDSKKYTIQKLSINSFVSLFKNPYLGAGASIYCNEKELYKNDDILKAWDINVESFLLQFAHIKNSQTYLNDITLAQKVVICKGIKTYCNAEIKKIIKEDAQICELIFKGERNFEQPYVANFIFKNNTLQLNNIEDFSVTTGSGRSKGKYTIEIKPK